MGNYTPTACVKYITTARHDKCRDWRIQMDSAVQDIRNAADKLRRHPLAVRALSILVSESQPQPLQVLARQLGVHIVSAHRAMKLLTTMKLIAVSLGENGRYRYFKIQESKRDLVKQLIEVVKTELRAGRPITSVVQAIESTIGEALREAGLKIRMTPQGPYDYVLQDGKLTVGIEIKALSGVMSPKRQLHQLVGSICFAAMQFPNVITVLFAGDDKKLMEDSRAVETLLKKADIRMKILWVEKTPTEVTPSVINEDVVKPIITLLQVWKNQDKADY